MAPKRSREQDGPDLNPSRKKQKGFSVGPADLPEGNYKRKVQKIKKDLIQNAKIKKEYAKVRARELEPQQESREGDGNDDAGATTTMHPDRVSRLNDVPSPSPPPQTAEKRPRQRRPKQKRQPFEREANRAVEQRKAREERKRRAEEAEAERQQKLMERERARRTMANARRGGRDGQQRKLGRESVVLLDRVKKLMGS